MDLSTYWYESGRIRDLLFRNNCLIDCNALGRPNGFIQIGVSGFSEADAPKIHERIEISNNDFYGIESFAVVAGGVKDLILPNNRTDLEGGLPIRMEE